MATVKTAISVPRGIYLEMEKLSKKLGVPRSRLFARAAAEFLQRRSGQALTDAINKAWAGGMSEDERDFVAGARRAFGKAGEGSW